MSKISYAILTAGMTLDVCLLWRLLRKALWREYPGLFSYVLYDLIATCVLFGILRSSPHLYRSLYWKSEIVSMSLGFLVVWEIFRHTFPKGSILRAVVAKGFATVALIPIIFTFSVFWALASYAKFHYLYPVFERSFGFVLSALVLATLLATKYYHVSLGRNVWGIALGFGAYVSISTAIFGLVDVTNLFVPYMQVLRPLSFIAMLATWTWAVWIYVPNPPIAVGRAAALDVALSSWSDNWRRTISAIWRTIHP
ncbi:MAG TPA: hypothetical protein VNE63_00010 [Candidatus Acidoferrales bacterium]|nr:hypothetical protein [Candidatus Acidoferrales bacterium]